jgi:hypothetical protein
LFLPFAFCLALAIRFVLCLFRECELRSQRLGKSAGWWRSLCQAFLSNHPDRSIRDYWLNFSIGFLELLAYPYFIAEGNLKVIGAWLALKTVVQWKGWDADSRAPYQRFLLGNALVIAFSVGLAQLLRIHGI